MDFSALIERQISADRRRGFQVDFANDAERVAQLEKDVIGLVGEVGEFANALKKVGLTIAHPGYRGPSLEEAAPNLSEELADAFIYLARLSFVLGRDFEADIIRKMQRNDARYAPLE
jgi:NTP pyrophosphatase (non-canonical NTP hydrolase)